VFFFFTFLFVFIILFVSSFFPLISLGFFVVVVMLLWVFYFYLYSYYLFSFYTINFTIITFSSLLHSPSFSCATIHSSHSQLLILPLLIHFSPPVFTYPSKPPPTCHHTTPPSYTLTACRLLYHINFTQPKHPAIHHRSTLHYNNRNIPKHTQGTQKPAAPTLLPPLTHPTYNLPFLPPYPTPQISVASLTNFNPLTSTA
jgi:hypothetical protein